MDLKDKIIEAGYELFAENGYDKTSVAQIIKKAGASKGGFYHHFKSKEDILETITFKSVDIVKVYYREILDSKELSMEAKFTQSYIKLGEFKSKSLADWPKLTKLYDFKGNHILLKRMGESFQEATTEFYEELILDGITEGVFNTKYPKQVANLWSREVMVFHRSVRHLLFAKELSENEFNQQLEFNEKLINEQLSLKAGTIPIVAYGKEYVETMKASAIEAGLL